jgi:seryl-tRNA synthetase
MLDIKFIKENADLFKDAVRKKHISFNIDELLKAEEDRLQHLSLVESLRAEQNAISDKVAKAGPEEREKLIGDMKAFKENLKEKEEALKEVMKTWQALMLQVPNIPDMSVPEGESDADNQELKKWGDVPVFDFKPKDHIELMENLDLVDFERGTKVSGFRGYFLKNEGAQIEMAIWQYAVEFLTKRGFNFIVAPSLVRKEPFVGTGFLPQSEEDLYKVGPNEYLAGTAEVPTMGYFMDEVLPKEKLPQKLLAFSPCFRAEAGKHGKDVKGLIRVHEFFKMEQVVLCEASHEESVKFHEEILKNSEEFVQSLGLHYRVVVNCGGDLGLGQVKKYDIEVWMPSQEKYRETHSASYFHDFQTRRLNIKYRDNDEKMRYAHSLNNTLVATPRMIACIVENGQQADGSIKIPEVLQKFLGKDKISK